MAGGAGKGKPDVVALLAQIGVVWSWLGIGYLAVNFPCHVAFEASNDLSFAFAFGGAFVYVGLGSPAC